MNSLETPPIQNFNEYSNKVENNSAKFLLFHKNARNILTCVFVLYWFDNVMTAVNDDSC